MLSFHRELSYQEYEPQENADCRKGKWVTALIIGGGVMAVSLITFGQGYIIMGTIFLSMVPFSFGLYWLSKKCRSDEPGCLNFLRRIFCCTNHESPELLRHQEN
ncbi:uncharacterized protein LOC129974898 [Argiope bruennichi]|uniref:uncharacterized protein LOC129974898 n=1 Tax=Argiope bruennichi TaxID=94029 RepID=UPI002494DA8A|nr:uncharacterized protein LOC129974898 [Argiope bruennichi]